MQTESQESIDPQVEELFKAGVQFGYARTRRHPRMREFIAGVKSNIEIFHLEKVKSQFDKALLYLEELGKSGSIILWVGTKPAAAPFIKKVAENLAHLYINGRWIGGTLTNFDVIKKRINYWRDLISKQKSGELEKYTKQEQSKFQKEIDRLSKSFEGLASLDALPAALFVIDSNEEAIAVKEAVLKRIPVVALLNTDCDPSKIDYPIPGNDNSPESIRYIIEKAAEAYRKGKSNATS